MPAIPLGRWDADALELTGAAQEGKMNPQITPEETERKRLDRIAQVKRAIVELEWQRDALNSELATLVRDGRDAEVSVMAAALPAEAVQEVVALAKIPGVKRLRELTDYSLKNAVDVYDVLRENNAAALNGVKP